MTLIDLYWQCNNGTWQEDAATDTQWALREIQGVHYLIFPPTGSVEDWVQNFDFWPMLLPWKRPSAVEPYRLMPSPWKAHEGFVKKYQAVRDAIQDAVFRASPSRLVVAGFSQGGALATLAFEDILFNRWQLFPSMDLKGVVFGAPRAVGWRAPSSRWKGFTRYEVRGDPVPHVPPFLFGFKHVGKRVKIGEASWPDPMRHAKYGQTLPPGVAV